MQNTPRPRFMEPAERSECLDHTTAEGQAAIRERLRNRTEKWAALARQAMLEAQIMAD